MKTTKAEKAKLRTLNEAELKCVTGGSSGEPVDPPSGAPIGDPFDPPGGLPAPIPAGA